MSGCDIPKRVVVWPPPEEPPCLAEIEPETHDFNILVSGESHDPVALLCSCGKRYRVVPE